MSEIKKAAIYLAILLLPAMAEADSFSFKDAWRACANNAECVVMRDVCGNADAVNRHYEKEAATHVRENAPRVNCSGDGASDITKLSAQCVKGNCGVVHGRD